MNKTIIVLGAVFITIMLFSSVTAIPKSNIILLDGEANIKDIINNNFEKIKEYKKVTNTINYVNLLLLLFYLYLTMWLPAIVIGNAIYCKFPPEEYPFLEPIYDLLYDIWMNWFSPWNLFD